MKGYLFCGITLKWDYSKRTVRLIMPDYDWLAIERFQHRLPTAKTGSPHEFKEPVYGIKLQYANDTYTSPLFLQ